MKAIDGAHAATGRRDFDSLIIGYKEAGEVLEAICYEKGQLLDWESEKEVLFECLVNGDFKLQSSVGQVSIISANIHSLLVVA